MPAEARPAPPGWMPRPRGAVLLGIAAAGLWAAGQLGVGLGDLVPGQGGLELAREFFARAVTPALTYESGSVVAGAPPLPLKALAAAHRTIVFAAAAMSLALVIGLPLAVAASSSFWEGDAVAGRASRRRVLLRGAGRALHAGTRVLIALMRSIHELLWAVLFLAAFGLTDLSAVVAIAIPYGGTLAKVFSEMIDEAPREAADALRGAGASPLQVFLFGLLPRALGDMAAYSFYRFECALRSSAILGFFGFPTLGYAIAVSFENLYFGEVWTYLYTLVALVVVADWWSGALRRRLVS
jgi:phosphonate transport system permease protein